MKNLLILFFFLNFSLHAQYSVKGTLNPVKKHSWVLLYKVEGAKHGAGGVPETLGFDEYLKIVEEFIVR